ncbi:FAD-dependent oxidoreductase, partial [Vibrio cholerae]
LHLLDREQAQHKAGIQLAHGGLFFPQGGWVHPPALCQWQATHPLIEVLTHHEALELHRLDDQWQARADDRLLASASVVVLAGAAEIKRFPFTADVPLKRIRGQITRLAQTPA